MKELAFYQIAGRTSYNADQQIKQWQVYLASP